MPGHSPEPFDGSRGRGLLWRERAAVVSLVALGSLLGGLVLGVAGAVAGRVAGGSNGWGDLVYAVLGVIAGLFLGAGGGAWVVTFRLMPRGIDRTTSVVLTVLLTFALTMVVLNLVATPLPVPPFAGVVSAVLVDWRYRKIPRHD